MLLNSFLWSQGYCRARWTVMSGAALAIIVAFASSAGAASLVSVVLGWGPTNMLTPANGTVAAAPATGRNEWNAFGANGSQPYNISFNPLDSNGKLTNITGTFVERNPNYYRLSLRPLNANSNQPNITGTLVQATRSYQSPWYVTATNGKYMPVGGILPPFVNFPGGTWNANPNSDQSSPDRPYGPDTLTLTGLNPVGRYDVYIYSAYAEGIRIGGNIPTVLLTLTKGTAATTSYRYTYNMNDPKLLKSYQLGTNYEEFKNVTPTRDGMIAIAGTGVNTSLFNAFQLYSVHSSFTPAQGPVTRATYEHCRGGQTPCQVEIKADALLNRMTLGEKIRLLSGNSPMTQPIKRLGIPFIFMNDASCGIVESGLSTAYPASVCLAATWNRKLAHAEGVAIAHDAQARGVDLVLGPGMNVEREPQDGRNFEFLGEDPFLTSAMAVHWIRGLQSSGVAACAKHFVGYEDGIDAGYNSVISRRALEEIYLPPFRAAVRRGHTWSMMCAYSQLNGVFCAQDKFLLTDILRRHWGFKGVLMSDWGANHACARSLNAGLDLEMPNAGFYSQTNIRKALAGGRVSITTINAHVRRILRLIVGMGFANHSRFNHKITLNDPASAAVALRVAAEGTVLLKNKNHILPLHRKKLKRIVVWGPMASPAVTGGGGSAYVHPILKPPVSMLDAIIQAAGPHVKVHFLGNRSAAQSIVSNPVSSPAERQAIAKAGVVIACVGFGPQHEGEGIDRGYRLWGHQNQDIRAIAKLNPHTVVVVNAGAGIGMSSWIHKVAGLIYAWYPGENGNTAVARIIFGKIDPSGRLPDTFSQHWRDEPAYGHFPAVNNVIDFTSGIYTGYRWYDKMHIKPLYPFGFGLSYTTFGMRHLRVTSTGTGTYRTYEVTVQVTNTGKMAGAEVIQLYLHPLVDRRNRCVQTLKGFARLHLLPGQSKTVRMQLDWHDFAYYDTADKGWQVPPGKYEIAVGSSSVNEPLHKIVHW